MSTVSFFISRLRLPAGFWISRLRRADDVLHWSVGKKPRDDQYISSHTVLQANPKPEGPDPAGPTRGGRRGVDPPPLVDSRPETLSLSCRFYRPLNKQSWPADELNIQHLTTRTVGRSWSCCSAPGGSAHPRRLCSGRLSLKAALRRLKRCAIKSKVNREHTSLIWEH